jgi:hypothetical protein
MPQYFVTVVPWVEVVQPAGLDVQNCKFEEGVKIKLRPLGIHAVEEFAPVLLAGRSRRARKSSALKHI